MNKTKEINTGTIKDNATKLFIDFIPEITPEGFRECIRDMYNWVYNLHTKTGVNDNGSTMFFISRLDELSSAYSKPGKTKEVRVLMDDIMDYCSDKNILDLAEIFKGFSDSLTNGIPTEQLIKRYLLLFSFLISMSGLLYDFNHYYHMQWPKVA